MALQMKVIEAGVFKRLRELLLDCPSPVQVREHAPAPY